MTTSPAHRLQHHVADHELSVISAGPGDGEPVLLVHGIPTGAELWRDVLGGLADAGFRGHAPDLPGYGQTVVPPDADHSLAGAAELLAAWLRSSGSSPCWVVGHDLGGAVAQVLAVRHPDLVGRLSLTNSVAGDRWPVAPISILIFAARARLFPTLARFGPTDNPVTRRMIARAYQDTSRLTDDVLQRVFLDRKLTDPAARRAFARHLRQLDPAQTVDVLHDLCELDVPCQLIWGTDDPFQPFERSGRVLEEALPEPDVIRLDGCGHFTPLECPERLLQALRSWRGG